VVIRYVSLLFASTGKHLGEPALVLLIAVTISVMYVGTGLKPPLLPLLMAMILLQFVVASWRVYRTQQIVITTKQSLADLDAFDRAQSEQSLRTHYHHREQRQEQRYEANLKRLDANIAALTARLRGNHS
jgi:hypothetical protein